MAKNSKPNIPSPQLSSAKKKAPQKITGDIPKWAIAAVLLFTALLYLNALHNGFVGYDDDDYLKLNPYIKDFSLHGIKIIFSTIYFSNYHPLTTFIYLLEYTLFGLHPLPYHLVNVLLHLTNIWLVYKLAEKLSGKRMVGLLAALLFAIHPMHVESVAWVSETKDVLYACFYLLSLVVYLRYLQSRRQYYYAGALFLFILSLLSKSAAITLPMLLITIDLYKSRKRDGRFYFDKIPFLALSILFGVFTILAQGANQGVNLFSFSYGWTDKIFLNTYAISFYLVKCVAPFHLSVLHFLPDNSSGMLPWEYYASLLFLVILTWFIIRKTSLRKEIVFGISFFLITVSVMLQIFQVGNAVTAERYSYIPFIGLFYLAAQWISEIFKKRKQNTALIALLSFILLIFVFQTWSRIRVWKDGETLFTDVTEKSPAVFAGYLMLGELKYNNGDLQGALTDINKSISLDSGVFKAFNLRGLVYYKLGQMNAALPDFNKALRLKQDFVDGFINRGMAYLQLGNFKSGFPDFNKAILMKPNYADAYNKRGSAHALTGDTLSAMRDYNKAVQLDPYLTDAYINRGFLKAKSGKDLAAINDYNYAIKYDPEKGTAYFNRGVSNLHLTDSAGACNDWRKAFRLGYAGAEQFINHYCR